MTKWFTCAPCRFPGDEAFFGRDSGLFWRGLEDLGHESKVILEGPPYDGDLPCIVRGSRRELESADWWRNLKLDGVIMVAWARHRDTRIVRAIAASGTPLVLHIDGSGNPFPLFRQVETIRTTWRAERDVHRLWAIRSLVFLKNLISQATRQLVLYSYLKYKHLQYATVVTLQTPTSLEGHRQLCLLFGGRNHRVNLQLAGYPIDERFKWDPSIPKQKRMVAIGRWGDLRQKRPFLLMDVCERIARLHHDLQIDIFGSTTDALLRWHAEISPDLRARIHVHGRQPPESICRAIQPAQISFFPSAFEGGPQALFEGLACGLTTVGLDSPSLPGGRFAAAYHHADLVDNDTPEAFVAALDRGLKKWESGEYSARQISDFWIQKVHVSKVISVMLEAASKAAPDKPQPAGSP